MNIPIPQLKKWIAALDSGSEKNLALLRIVMQSIVL